MQITKIMTFDAAHQLPNEECYGACSNLHGHTYKLEVTVAGPIRKEGWVMNFKDLKQIMKKYVDCYDHANLNDFYDLPTAENMVQYMYEQMVIDLGALKLGVVLYSVRLWETPTSYAEAGVNLL